MAQDSERLKSMVFRYYLKRRMNYKYEHQVTETINMILSLSVKRFKRPFSIHKQRTSYLERGQRNWFEADPHKSKDSWQYYLENLLYNFFLNNVPLSLSISIMENQVACEIIGDWIKSRKFQGLLSFKDDTCLMSLLNVGMNIWREWWNLLQRQLSC